MVLKLRRLSYALVAEVCDIDVGKPMSESSFGAIPSRNEVKPARIEFLPSTAINLLSAALEFVSTDHQPFEYRVVFFYTLFGRSALHSDPDLWLKAFAKLRGVRNLFLCSGASRPGRWRSQVFEEVAGQSFDMLAIGCFVYFHYFCNSAALSISQTDERNVTTAARLPMAA